jgi:monoamine oxidase
MEHISPHRWKHQNFRKLLDDGLNATPSRECRVAIVGAGMAGLVCGRLMTDAGFRVDIYEASQRVGGRIKTLREGFSSGLYAEAGAMRIPGSHGLTRALCELCGITPFEFPENEAGLVFINNKRFLRSEYASRQCAFGDAYPGRTASDILKRTMGTFLTRKGKYRSFKTLTDTQRAKLDSFSFGDYLRAFLGEEQGGKHVRPVTRRDLPGGGVKTSDVIHPAERIAVSDIDLIGFEHGAADLKASFLEVYRDRLSIHDTEKYQIPGGMDMLPHKYADQKRLVDRIRFNARVRMVRRTEGGFEIGFENPVTHVQYRQFAHYVVLAAPFSALTHVRFGNDVVPAKTLRAIRNLHYENATKIVLEFDERFWEADHGITNGGFSFTDLPIRWVYYPPKQQNRGRHGLLLASYTWGEDSLRWGSLKPSERIRFALADIAHLHGHGNDSRRLSYYEQHLVGGMSHSWAEDEYTFGAFAIFDPHQETELFDNAWRPYRGMHFAGEHTSLKHAWIEGAVESGIRAAREVSLEETSGRNT